MSPAPSPGPALPPAGLCVKLLQCVPCLPLPPTPPAAPCALPPAPCRGPCKAPSAAQDLECRPCLTPRVSGSAVGHPTRVSPQVSHQPRGGPSCPWALPVQQQQLGLPVRWEHLLKREILAGGPLGTPHFSPRATWDGRGSLGKCRHSWVPGEPPARCSVAGCELSSSAVWRLRDTGQDAHGVMEFFSLVAF